MSSAEERRKQRYNALVANTLATDGTPQDPKLAVGVTAAKAPVQESPRKKAEVQSPKLVAVPEDKPAEAALGSSIHMLELSPRGGNRKNSGSSSPQNRSLNASDNIINIWNQVSSSQRDVVLDNVVNRKILKHSIQVERFTDQAEKEYHKQGDLDFYSAMNLEKRAKLADSLPIKEIISKWWRLVPKNFNDDVEKPMYVALIVAVTKVLSEDFNKRMATETADKDWTRDSKGRDAMNKKAFYAAIYEIADMWCDVVSCRAYCIFLETVRRHVAKDDGIHLRDLNFVQPGSALQAYHQIMAERKIAISQEKPYIEEFLQFVPHWRMIVHDNKIASIGDFARHSVNDDNVFSSTERVELARQVLAKFADEIATSGELDTLYPQLINCEASVADLFNSPEHDWVSIMFKHRITKIGQLARIRACLCPATVELRLFLSDYYHKTLGKPATIGGEDDEGIENCLYPPLITSTLPMARVVQKLPGVRVHAFFDLYEIETMDDLDLLTAKKLSQLQYMDAILLKQGLEYFVKRHPDLHYFSGLFKLWHRIKATHLSTLVDHETRISSAWIRADVQKGQDDKKSKASSRASSRASSAGSKGRRSGNRTPSKSPVLARKNRDQGGVDPIAVANDLALLAKDGDEASQEATVQHIAITINKRMDALVRQGPTDLSMSVTNTDDIGVITTNLPNGCVVHSDEKRVTTIKLIKAGLKRNSSSSKPPTVGGRLSPRPARNRPASAVSPRARGTDGPIRAPSNAGEGKPSHGAATILITPQPRRAGHLAARNGDTTTGPIRRSKSMTFDDDEANDRKGAGRQFADAHLPPIGAGGLLAASPQSTRRTISDLLASPSANRRRPPSSTKLTAPVQTGTLRPKSPRARPKSPRRFQSVPVDAQSFGLAGKALKK